MTETPAPDDSPEAAPGTGKPAPPDDASNVQTEPSTEPGDLPPSGNIFADAETALNSLQSYRYQATASYGGTMYGETAEGSYELEGAVSGDDRYRLEWLDRRSGSRFAVMEIDGQAWMLEGGSWQSVPSSVAEGMAAAVSMYVPADSWDALEDDFLGEPVYEGEQTINGIRTRHYSSEQFLTEEGETLEARGEVWIAEDGGYPVRFTMEADISDGEGGRSSMQMTVELSDVNAAVTIEPPR